MAKKILIINYEYPPLGGGGGHASREIARRLIKMGFGVSVLTSRFRDLPAFEVQEGVRVYRLPTIRRHQEKCSVFEMAVFLVMSLFWAVWLRFRERPEVVVSFFSIPGGPAAYLLSLLFGTPYAIALRGGDVPGFLPEQLATFHKMTNGLTRLMWRRARFLTANSRGLGDLAWTFYDGTEIRIIANGVGEKFYKPRVVPTQGQLKLLAVGRLSQQKRLERQIELMARLKQQGLTALRLDIVGDGPLRPELEKLAAAAGVLGESVFFLGWCQRDRIHEVYQAADILLMTSDFEGMPNVVLEAMAASVAILGTRSPGTDELVQNGRNGWLVDKNRLSDLDATLIRLTNHREELLTWQRAAHEVALTYTWDAVAEQYAKLCEDAVLPKKT